MSQRVISFEEACKAQGLDPLTVLPDVSNMPVKDQKALTAFAKMCIVQRSLNGDWQADWSNYNQKKCFPWFNVEEKEGSASGFGLSYLVFGYDNAATNLGVRLFYPDLETAKYAGETFIEFYEDMILIPK